MKQKRPLLINKHTTLAELDRIAEVWDSLVAWARSDVVVKLLRKYT